MCFRLQRAQRPSGRIQGRARERGKPLRAIHRRPHACRAARRSGEVAAFRVACVPGACLPPVVGGRLHRGSVQILLGRSAVSFLRHSVSCVSVCACVFGTVCRACVLAQVFCAPFRAATAIARASSPRRPESGPSASPLRSMAAVLALFRDVTPPPGDSQALERLWLPPRTDSNPSQRILVALRPHPIAALSVMVEANGLAHRLWNGSEPSLVERAGSAISEVCLICATKHRYRYEFLLPG